MTDTYIRYTQEVFTNKYAMEAMMRNNQEVAEQNKEILFKYGLVRMSRVSLMMRSTTHLS